MIVEHVPIDRLLPDPANVRTHPERNVEAIKASLARFGQQKPIVVDAAGVVRAGNGTLHAARALGWESVAVVRTPLKGSEATAYSIADNRTADLAEWDFQGLAGLLKGLRDEGAGIDDLGWADFELEPMLAAEWAPPPLAELPGADADGDGPDGAGPHHVIFTEDQYAIVLRAVERVRAREADDGLSLGRCLELICADFLAGPYPDGDGDGDGDGDDG